MNWDRLFSHCRCEGDRGLACWLWLGRLTPQGYAATDRILSKKYFGAKTDSLHVAVAMEHVDWTPASHTRHGCDVKCCVSPHHIAPGTKVQNSIDWLNSGTHNTRILTEEQVREIRRDKSLTRKQVAEKYGISPSTAKKVICGYTWKHVDARV